MSCPPTRPGTDTYTDHGSSTPSTGGCGNWYSSCRNPLYALDHQSECGAVQVAYLDLVPSTVELAKGRSAYVRLIATFADGRVADVTGEGTFGVEDQTVATSSGAGMIQGVDVGSANLTGTWRGLLATGSVSVFDNQCVESRPWDVVIVADDAAEWVSGTVSVVHGSAVVRGRALRRLQTPYANQYSQAMLALQLSMDLLDSTAFDPRAGWSVAGGLRPGIGPRTGLDRIAFPGGPGWTNTIQAFPGGRPDVGRAIMEAYALHGIGRSDARKVIVIFSTGGESLCSPGMLAAANAVKGAGIHVAVVTPLGSGDLVYSFCNQPQTAWAVLQQASSTCLFFDQTTGNIQANVMANTLRIACEGCGSSGSGIGLGNL